MAPGIGMLAAVLLGLMYYGVGPLVIEPAPVHFADRSIGLGSGEFGNWVNVLGSLSRAVFVVGLII